MRAGVVSPRETLRGKTARARGETVLQRQGLLLVTILESGAETEVSSNIGSLLITIIDNNCLFLSLQNLELDER